MFPVVFKMLDWILANDLFYFFCIVTVKVFIVVFTLIRTVCACKLWRNMITLTSWQCNDDDTLT